MCNILNIFQPCLMKLHRLGWKVSWHWPEILQKIRNQYEIKFLQTINTEGCIISPFYIVILAKDQLVVYTTSDLSLLFSVFFIRSINTNPTLFLSSVSTIRLLLLLLILLQIERKKKKKRFYFFFIFYNEISLQCVKSNFAPDPILLLFFTLFKKKKFFLLWFWFLLFMALYRELRPEWLDQNKVIFISHERIRNDMEVVGAHGCSFSSMASFTSEMLDRARSRNIEPSFCLTYSWLSFYSCLKFPSFQLSVPSCARCNDISDQGSITHPLQRTS